MTILAHSIVVVFPEPQLADKTNLRALVSHAGCRPSNIVGMGHRIVLVGVVGKQQMSASDMNPLSTSAAILGSVIEKSVEVCEE